MSPIRRKGASKAAAVAAPRGKWNVGDLVLAKVKGFPEWPATVSEPEKWGYRPDQKKVVVQFFGSDQIAFCNPADIEDFTEENKVSLLGKRNEKGADFVRAVNEIIDCFEKLKKQDQVGRANLVFTETSVSATHSTRSKMVASRSQNNGAHSQRKPARPLRSSSRIDACSLQSEITLSNNSNRSSRRQGAVASEDRSLRRSRRIIKTSDDSESQDVDSLTNRKSHNNVKINAAKPVIVALDAEEHETECVLPSPTEKPTQKHAMDYGDEHLPLVKRARFRMGSPSPAAEVEISLVHKEEILSEVPESHSVKSFEPLSCMVETSGNRDSVAVKEPALSSLPHVSLASKPRFLETRKNLVDVEAVLPPSKRLHRALEAMSANVARACHKDSDCSPAVDGQSDRLCNSSSLECSEMSSGKKDSGAAEDLNNGDSLSIASDLFAVSNVERSENSMETIAAVLDCAKTFGTAGKNPEFCTGSSAQGGGTGSPNVDTCNQLKSADGIADESHRTNDLLSAENNQYSKMSEFGGEARPASLNPKNMPPVTPVEVLNSGHHQSLSHSTSVPYNKMDDRTVSITQFSSSLTNGPDSVPRACPTNSSVCNISALDNNKSLGNNGSSPPDVQLRLEKAKHVAKTSSKEEALSSFEATINSLTRTKESIGRATRIAIDCAKFGFATKVVEILIHHLENESSLHKKVDLFFLVDSIIRFSRDVNGDGGVYPSAVQALLPRLLLAAAPPGNSTHENHWQCLKVLKLWQERKIIPEPIIRHHIRELDELCGGSYPTMSSNRSLRNEGDFDDPIREMDGMQVDEYGSNSSIHLPGFCMPRDIPMSSAPLSRSPLPPPPPPLPPALTPPVSNGSGSKPYSTSHNPNSYQPNDAYRKSFHLRPPLPAPSNQFSYLQGRVQLPSRPNIFNSRNSDGGNFYRDHKFVQRDNIGEGWRTPFPSISGPCFPDGPSMANAPISYGGPPREPPIHHNSWNFPSRPMNHMHFNPYRPPTEAPIQMANRGPNYGRPR